MGCACGSRANIEEHIRDFVNDMVISHTSINEYKKNLFLTIKNGKIFNSDNFEYEFLNPLFESTTGQFKEIKNSVKDFFYKIKDEYFPYFILALAFLCDTINFSALKSNYEIILYEGLPDNLTKVIKTKNDLRVFKKFLKFYIRLVSQFIVSSLQNIYDKDIEDKNALEDLKIIYSDIFINELLRKLFINQNEKDFNLEKFLKLNYENLKHNSIREKLFEIFSTSPKLIYENEIDDTDIFSSVESEGPDRNMTNDRIEELEWQLEKSQEDLEESTEHFVVQNKKEEPKKPLYDEKILNIAAKKITNSLKSNFFKNNFLNKVKPDLVKQQNKIHEYIVANFPSEKVKKAENNKKQEFNIEGWKKFYPENTKIFNINHGEVHETKFLIFKGNEYYSGLLNRIGQKHGFGISILRQGEKYQGFFFENKYHGWGEMIDKSGNIFQGQFIHGVLSGKGEKFSLDGTYYIGDFENFSKSGEGQEDSEFYIYRGSFKNNKKNGKGKIYLKVLKDWYEGDFHDDSITGHGEYYWSNSNTYVGQFLNGKMHGKGVNKWPDGTEYEGEYKNGIKDGFGKYKKANGKIYEGLLRNGKPHGKGMLVNEKGRFEVEFVDGKMISGPDSKNITNKNEIVNNKQVDNLGIRKIDQAEAKLERHIENYVDDVLKEIDNKMKFKNQHNEEEKNKNFGITFGNKNSPNKNSHDGKNNL